MAENSDSVFTSERSSMIERIEYDATTSTLTVAFRNGRVYMYSAVPQDIFEALRSAESVGRCFNSRVRDHFGFTEIG